MTHHEIPTNITASEVSQNNELTRPTAELFKAALNGWNARSFDGIAPKEEIAEADKTYRRALIAADRTYQFDEKEAGFQRTRLATDVNGRPDGDLVYKARDMYENAIQQATVNRNSSEQLALLARLEGPYSPSSTAWHEEAQSEDPGAYPTDGYITPNKITGKPVFIATAYRRGVSFPEAAERTIAALQASSVS